MEAFDNLSHQIALLTINPKSGRLRRREELALATAGGALAELALQERVSLVDKKVRVHDERPTEDPLLDTMLAVLADQPDRRPTRILNAARRRYLKQAEAELVTNGWVSIVEEGVFRPRYAIEATELVEGLRDRVAATLRDPDSATARQVCLAGLACELRLAKQIAPDLSWGQRHLAKRKLRQRDWVVKAMADIIAARAAAAAGSAG